MSSALDLVAALRDAGLRPRVSPAVGPLAHLVDETFFKPDIFARGAAAGLDRDETLAIVSYCAGDTEALNGPLRRTSAADLANAQPLIAAMDRALAKLPRVRALVYRVEIPYVGEASLRSGSITRNAGFLSTTRDMRNSADPVRVLEIETISGRDVSKLSGFTREAEVIIPRGAALLVISRRFVTNPDGTRCLHVRLRELP